MKMQRVFPPRLICIFRHAFQSRAHESLPFAVLGTVGVLAALISVNLPETADEQVVRDSTEQCRVAIQ